MSTDINIGALSEALNNKLDIGCMNSNSTTANGLNTNGIRTLVEVSDKSLLPSYYRVYSDGWCEQGGESDTSGTVNFLKTYLSRPIVSFSPVINTISEFEVNSVSTEKFTWSCNQANTKATYICWNTCGYIS